MIKIKKKVLFGITSLQLGGAERVLVDIVNKLQEEYDITLFSIYDNGELKKELSNNIKFKTLYECKYEDLNFFRKKWAPLRILLLSSLLYKKYIKKDYDIEVSFLEGPITRLFSKKNKNTKKITWIHNDIKRVFGNGIKATIKRYLDGRIYKRYDNLVFVSNDNMKSFKRIYQKIDDSKMRLIYNYINPDLVIEKSNKFIPTEFKDLEKVKFVSVCRLVEQKAVDRFIEIHSKLIKSGYIHKVFIIGDGPQRDYLNELIKYEGVSDTFYLLGKKENPYPYIKYADYFCLLSYFEGYGMVLEEAKILNKNIIITDTAAREAVKDYRYTTILNNEKNAIYEGLLEVIKSNSDTSSRASEKYDNSNTLKQIKELLNS